MWATFDLDHAQQQLNAAIHERLGQHPVAPVVDTLCFPVGFFFVRGDRAGPGAELAEQVLSSYGFWNADAGKYFDMIFPGWGKDGERLVFDRDAFIHCRDQLQEVCRWRHGGETDVLLFNAEVSRGPDGLFTNSQWSFAESIWLPVEEMVRDGRVAHLDALMHEIITHAKAAWDNPNQPGIWEISDRVAYYRGRRLLWEQIKKFFLRDLAKIYDELRPYAVCDLRLPHVA